MITEVEIRELARKLKDFDMYDASMDVEAAWSYLLAVSEAKDDEYFTQLIAKNKPLKNTIKANYRRRKAVAKQLAHEDVEEYKNLYKSELSILDSYCYTALGDYFAEKYPEETVEVMVQVAEAVVQKKALAQEKREKTKANNAVKYAERAYIAAEERAIRYLEKAEVAGHELELAEQALAEAKAKEQATEAAE